MSVLRLAGIIRESIVDGPGLRFVVFAQGCPHHCPGCHNPETWAFEGGFETTPQRLLEEMAKNPLLRGVTLSGGEPFCQPGALAEVAEGVRARGKDVLTYTGYLYEELTRMAQEDDSVARLLRATDVLIDGPFRLAERSLELRFRGSRNQRAIDVPASLARGAVVEAEL